MARLASVAMVTDMLFWCCCPSNPSRLAQGSVSRRPQPGASWPRDETNHVGPAGGRTKAPTFRQNDLDTALHRSLWQETKTSFGTAVRSAQLSLFAVCYVETECHVHVGYYQSAQWFHTCERQQPEQWGVRGPRLSENHTFLFQVARQTLCTDDEPRVAPRSLSTRSSLSRWTLNPSTPSRFQSHINEQSQPGGESRQGTQPGEPNCLRIWHPCSVWANWARQDQPTHVPETVGPKIYMHSEI